MKKITLLLLLSVPLFFASCEGGGSDDAYEPYTELPGIVGGYQLEGLIATIDSGDFTKYSGYSGKLVVTSPSVAHIKVDGYIRVTCTNTYTETLYLGIKFDDSLKYLYPIPVGDFDEYIYYREKGTNQLNFYQKISDTSYTTLASITATNTNNKIKYLVPSTRIQAFDQTIIDLAESIKATVTDETDIESIVRALHDYVVKDLYYDFDSLTDRKDQDALSVLDNGMAVCEGYSTLYAALLRSLGIKAQVYTGSGHAWNMVYWSGEWHDIDTTWDDPNMSVDGGSCELSTGEYCCSDYPDGENLRHDYFDTDFTGDEHHDGLVNDYYKK